MSVKFFSKEKYSKEYCSEKSNNNYLDSVEENVLSEESFSAYEKKVIVLPNWNCVFCSRSFNVRSGHASVNN